MLVIEISIGVGPPPACAFLYPLFIFRCEMLSSRGPPLENSILTATAITSFNYVYVFVPVCINMYILIPLVDRSITSIAFMDGIYIYIIFGFPRYIPQ